MNSPTPITSIDVLKDLVRPVSGDRSLKQPINNVSPYRQLVATINLEVADQITAAIKLYCQTSYQNDQVGSSDLQGNKLVIDRVNLTPEHWYELLLTITYARGVLQTIELNT